MTKEQLNKWTQKLGEGWAKLDVDLALSVINQENISWYESPLDGPLKTWRQVYDRWEKDLSDQKDVKFSHEVLICDDEQGIVRWQASLTRISTGQRATMDGIFHVRLNDEDKCTYFMMWVESKQGN